MGKLVVVVGGQFGSEAKGAVCAHLARTSDKALMAVRVAGPNAGHTVYDDAGNEFRLRAVPVAAAVRPSAQLRLAAGSEIDLEVLGHEIQLLNEHGHNLNGRIALDGQATMLTTEHQRREQGDEIQKRIGSTAKGIGAARSDRIWRQAPLIGGDVDVAHDIAQHLVRNGEVHIEGTQGYGLGLHAGFYPTCTSSDCRAIDFCAMAGVSPWQPGVDRFETWVVLRTYPIRVAGNSGPLKDEHTWDEMRQLTRNDDLAPERTTVTNKVRRIGGWDPELAKAAVVANGSAPTVRVALMFLDYVFPHLAGVDRIEALDGEVMAYVRSIEQQVGARVQLLGTGPQSIIDLRPGSQMAGQGSLERVEVD